MNRVKKVERPASQGTPATSEQAPQPSSSERFRKSQGGAHDTLQRAQWASDTERHVARRSKSTPLSNPKSAKEELERPGTSSLLKRLLSPRTKTRVRKAIEESTGQDSPSSTSASTSTSATRQPRELKPDVQPVRSVPESEAILELREENRRLKQQLEITLSALDQSKAKNLHASEGRDPSPPQTPDPGVLAASEQPLAAATTNQPLTTATATHPRQPDTLDHVIERILASEAIDQYLAPLQRVRDGVNPLTPPRFKND